VGRLTIHIHNISSNTVLGNAMRREIDLTNDPVPKRARPAPAQGAAAGSPLVVDSVPDGHASFSDEETSAPGVAAVSCELPGYDFSLSPGADANQPDCGLCGVTFAISWHDQKVQLVVHDAVLLGHRLYHMRCACDRVQLLQIRRGQGTSSR